MVKYRRRVDIIADILKIAVAGANKTKIMYFGNLSHRLLEKYLKQTIGAGFLSLDGRRYEVTDKGKSFLEQYSEFSRKYSNLESNIKQMSFEKEALERMCQVTFPSLRSNMPRRSRK